MFGTLTFLRSLYRLVRLLNVKESSAYRRKERPKKRSARCNYYFCEERYGADTSKCVDAGGGESPGTGLQLWTCNNQSQQRWGYDPRMATVYLADTATKAKSGEGGGTTMCMDVPGGSIKQGILLCCTATNKNAQLCFKKHLVVISSCHRLGRKGLRSISGVVTVAGIKNFW